MVAVVAVAYSALRARGRRRSRRRGHARLEPDDPEAQYAVGDLQVVVEALQQRVVVRLELEEVVLRLGPVVDLERHLALAPVVDADHRAALFDRLLDVAEDRVAALFRGL